MSDLKTKPTKQSVEEFLKNVEPEQKRHDSFEILRLLQKITNKKPVMWGPSIVGFGKYHYKYESGHEGDMCLAGFSPRKQYLVVYLMRGSEKTDDLMKKLGKYKTSVGCLYIKKLEDVDKNVLETLIRQSIQYIKNTYKVF